MLSKVRSLHPLRGLYNLQVLLATQSNRVGGEVASRVVGNAEEVTPSSLPSRLW